VLLSSSSTIVINASIFHHNIAPSAGGVLLSIDSCVEIEASEFHTNTGFIGGVLSSSISVISLKGSGFYNNQDEVAGGVLNSYGDFITVGDSDFAENVSPTGAIINARESSIQCQGSLLVHNNYASATAVIYLFNSEFRVLNSGNVTFSNNTGSLLAFNSDLIFAGHLRFSDNEPPPYTSFADTIEEGGAITLIQSQIYLRGACYLERNYAENGGAIHSTESQLYLQSNSSLTVAHNVATRNGGGIYLFSSELSSQQKSNFVLLNNTAMHKGGRSPCH
jgi:predicted outer membrane repeat protein